MSSPNVPIVSPEIKERWQEFFGELTPEAIIAALTQKLDPAYSTLSEFNEFQGKAEIALLIQKDEEPIATFTVRLVNRPDGKYHGEVAMIKNLQGDKKGRMPAAAQVAHNFFDMMREVERPIIKMDAALESGLPFWSRMGFVPDGFIWDMARENVFSRKLVELEHGGLPADVAETVRLALGNPDPKAIWVISDIRHDVPLPDWLGRKQGSVGQAILGNTKLSGAVNLDDPEVVARYQSYLAQRVAYYEQTKGSGGALV